MIRDALRRLLRRPSPEGSPPTAPVSSPPPPGTQAVPREESGLGSLDPAQVQAVIDERIRPALRADGGDIELVEIRGGDVHVRLQGACRGCPGASMTLRMGVEAILRDELPGFGRVVDLG